MNDKSIPIHWRLPIGLSMDMLNGPERQSHFHFSHPHNCVSAAARAWSDQLQVIVAQIGVALIAALVCVQHQSQNILKILASLLRRRDWPPVRIWTFLQTGVA
jgi:hypothetical protein